MKLETQNFYLIFLRNDIAKIHEKRVFWQEMWQNEENLGKVKKQCSHLGKIRNKTNQKSVKSWETQHYKILHNFLKEEKQGALQSLLNVLLN